MVGHDAPVHRPVILCRHVREGENYCAEHGLSPVTAIIVVTDQDTWQSQLRGRFTRPDDVHQVPGWIFGRNAQAIDAELQIQADRAS